MVLIPADDTGLDEFEASYSSEQIYIVHHWWNDKAEVYIQAFNAWGRKLWNYVGNTAARHWSNDLRDHHFPQVRREQAWAPGHTIDIDISSEELRFWRIWTTRETMAKDPHGNYVSVPYLVKWPPRSHDSDVKIHEVDGDDEVIHTTIHAPGHDPLLRPAGRGARATWGWGDDPKENRRRMYEYFAMKVGDGWTDAIRTWWDDLDVFAGFRGDIKTVKEIMSFWIYGDTDKRTKKWAVNVPDPTQPWIRTFHEVPDTIKEPSEFHKALRTVVTDPTFWTKLATNYLTTTFMNNYVPEEFKGKHRESYSQQLNRRRRYKRRVRQERGYRRRIHHGWSTFERRVSYHHRGTRGKHRENNRPDSQLVPWYPTRRRKRRHRTYRPYSYTYYSTYS